jgi:hypothetical protein
MGNIWAKHGNDYNVRRLVATDGTVFLVDRMDYHHLSLYTWGAVKKGNLTYARRFENTPGKIRQIWLHREIMRAPQAKHVDHISGDTLDNRKANLRFASQKQNTYNRAPRKGKTFKGVYQSGLRWRARIVVDGKPIHLGMYATVEEAAHAYDRAAVEHQGEFSRLNFPRSGGHP